MEKKGEKKGKGERWGKGLKGNKEMGVEEKKKHKGNTSQYTTTLLIDPQRGRKENGN